jgi:hypothetical protein
MVKIQLSTRTMSSALARAASDPETSALTSSSGAKMNPMHEPAPVGRLASAPPVSSAPADPVVSESPPLRVVFWRPTPSAQTETSLGKYKLLCATWNVGNTEPITLEPWIPAGGRGFDIIAVAAQECKLSSKYKEPAAGALDEEDEDDEGGGDSSDPQIMTRADRSATVAMLKEAMSKTNDAEPAHQGRRASRVFVPPGAAAAAASGDGLSSSDLGATAVDSASSEVGEAATLVSDHSLDIAGVRSAVETSPFFKMVLNHLGEGWVAVDFSLMFQTGLLVAVRREHSSLVTSTARAQEATGLLHVGMNKGGVVIAMTFNGTRLCFVGSHLAAHMQHLARRDTDIMEIVSQVRLGGELAPVDMDAQFDHVFWLGDLNYRVDFAYHEAGESKESKESFARSKAHVDAKEWGALQEHDQLLLRRKEGVIFHGFSEAPLDFPPTFKVAKVAGFEYKTKRTPSYCDRVLHKSLPRLEQFLSRGALTPHPSIKSSDHKPVSCDFDLDCRPPPQAAAKKDSEPRFVVRFHNLSGTDLIDKDWGKTSDPYIRFYASANDIVRKRADGRQPRTEHVAKTLNPKWSDSAVPDLVLDAESIEDLVRTHLFLVLMDHDEVDADDAMGQAVLPLEPVVQAAIKGDGGIGARTFSAVAHHSSDDRAGVGRPVGSGYRFHFQLPVTLATSRMGTLSGEAELILVKPGESFTVREGGRDKCCQGCINLDDGCCSVM